MNTNLKKTKNGTGISSSAILILIQFIFMTQTELYQSQPGEPRLASNAPGSAGLAALESVHLIAASP